MSLRQLLTIFLIISIAEARRTANFTSNCNKKLTCLEFFDCCRWYTESLCPGPRYEHCLTGINGKPIERSLACGCGIQSGEYSGPSGPDFPIDDLSPPPTFYGNKEAVLASCRMLMSALGSRNEPCRVFAMCCDALLGVCVSPLTGRQGRKTVYCTPQSVRSSYCECTPHEKDRSIFDLRRPQNGIGSLTQTCAYDSNNCQEFLYCCAGYLHYCPGKKKEVCVPREGSGFDKMSSLCECEFSRDAGAHFRMARSVWIAMFVWYCVTRQII